MPILIYWYYKWNCLKIMNERESYITLWSHSQDSWQQPGSEVMVEGGLSQKSMLRLDIGLLGLLVCVVLSASERTARVLWGSVLLWEPSTVAVMVLVSCSGSSWVLLVASPSSGGRCSFWEWEKREMLTDILGHYDAFEVAGNKSIWWCKPRWWWRPVNSSYQQPAWFPGSYIPTWEWDWMA